MTKNSSFSSIDGACLTSDLLSKALVPGHFVSADETLESLRHFVSSCPRCWRQLSSSAGDGSIEVDLEGLTRIAVRNPRYPPIFLTLGRLLRFLRDADSDAVLPPIHRGLHRGLKRLGGGGGFLFGWLLAESNRLLSFEAPARVERWHSLRKILARLSTGLDQDPSLLPLITAYESDEFRVLGDVDGARSALALALDKSSHCHPVIQATIFELQADLDRSEGDFTSALGWLRTAHDLLDGVRILAAEGVGAPGRQAETRARIGLVRWAQGQTDLARKDFKTALALIPDGTDAHLRQRILGYLDALMGGSLAGGSFSLNGGGELRR